MESLQLMLHLRKKSTTLKKKSDSITSLTYK